MPAYYLKVGYYIRNVCNIENNVLDANPDIYAGSYNTYLVFERTSPSPPTNTNIYLYDWNAKTTHNVTYSTASQSRPIISAEYSNCIVYMDNRNGNWDIYLTIFGYGLGATGPNSQSSSGASSGGTASSGDQSLVIISVIAVFVVSAVVGAAAFVAMKKRKPKVENNHPPNSKIRIEHCKKNKNSTNNYTKIF